MKNYKDVAADVFRRSNEVIEENKRRRKRMAGIGASAACWAAVGAVGFGIWRSTGAGVSENSISGNSISESAASAGQFANDGKDHSGESDVVLTNPSNGGNSADRVEYEGLKPAVYPPDDPNNVDERCLPFIHLPMQPAEMGVYSYELEVENTQVFKEPENGQIVFGKPLEAAMLEYGDGSRYSVIIEYFKDGERVDPTEELWKSEGERFGGDLYFEDAGDKHYTGINGATYDELKSFLPSENYGYLITLRGNYFVNTEPIDTEIRYLPSREQCYPEENESSSNYVLTGHIENIDVEYEETEYAPENETYVIGNSLKTAVDTYGSRDLNGELEYKVLIELYKDGERVETTKELYESLGRFNLASSSEDWGEHYEHYIWAHMTVEEIESFEPEEGYGCALHLYDAYLGYPYELMSNIINGLYNNGVYIE